MKTPQPLQNGQQYKRIPTRWAILIALGCMFGLQLTTLPSAALANRQPKTFLLVWASDKGTDDHIQDPDFLAVIGADPESAATYGKVLTTASLEAIVGKHLLSEVGLIPGITSNLLNEAHHFNSELYVGADHHKYLFPAGLISANIFKCDVTDPLNIPPCELVVDSSKVTQFTGTDEVEILPNGNLIATYMGAKNTPPTLPPTDTPAATPPFTLTTPGGLVEFTADGTVVAEYNASKPGGPIRYVPSIKGVSDTGLLAHPHGIDFRKDLDLLITADYADPWSLATSTMVPDLSHQDFGTTVRIWQLSNLPAGPQKIIQVPPGPRKEHSYIQEEPEGLMDVALMRKHLGALTASMSGGALYYTPDITVANPVFQEVYDFGPGTGASVFTLTPDDRFLIMPIAGIQSPGDAVYDRDYSGEHSRRVVVLDLKPLEEAGRNVKCGPPTVTSDPDGFTTGFIGHNNFASDCPVQAGVVGVDTGQNFATHGGPHYTQYDPATRTVVFSNYFVDLGAFGLPGTGSGGDDKVCLAHLGKDGSLALDTKFKDELDGNPCVNFDRPTSYSWPNGRGGTGNAKPHAVTFIHVN